MFVEQLQLLGQPGDMALVVSTSGKSPNLIYAVEAARERQMLTIAWLGKDGGAVGRARRLPLHRALLQYPPDPGSSRHAGAHRLGFDPYCAGGRRRSLNRLAAFVGLFCRFTCCWCSWCNAAVDISRFHNRVWSKSYARPIDFRYAGAGHGCELLT